MSDALASFDFNQVSGGGNIYLKFEAGKPLYLRVLTTDPLVYMDKFGNTRFAFIVYNFTEGCAQILQATPSVAKRIGEIHVDEDFGADIKKVDIKITPTGAGLERRYSIDVLPKAETLTNAQITEARGIDLEERISKNATLAQRMSFYDQEKFNNARKHFEDEGEAEEAARSGYDQAKAQADALRPDEELDEVIDVNTDEPINLDDIPF